jgi:hypothetical protein
VIYKADISPGASIKSPIDPDIAPHKPMQFRKLQHKTLDQPTPQDIVGKTAEKELLNVGESLETPISARVEATEASPGPWAKTKGSLPANEVSNTPAFPGLERR